MIGCYVDDLCCCYSHDDEHSLYRKFTTKLQADWEVEDEGELTDLLNVEFVFGDHSVELRQTGYIDKMVTTFMWTCPQTYPPRSTARFLATVISPN